MGTSRLPGRTPDAGPGPGPGTRAAASADATDGVTALYQAHAVGLIRLAIVMLGDRVAAEDVVQEAFFGLYRHWDGLADRTKALAYVRSAVLNRCRNVEQQRRRDLRRGEEPLTVESAEATVLVGQEHQHVLAAIRTLPYRQREALVLRFYLELSEDETALAMGISKGTVKSATSRAVAALGRRLKED